MSWSSMDWHRRLEDLIERCADKVFAEMEEQITSRLRAESQRMLENFLKPEKIGNPENRMNHVLIEESSEESEFPEHREEANLAIPSKWESKHENKEESKENYPDEVFYAFGIVGADSKEHIMIRGMEEKPCTIVWEGNLGMIVCPVQKSDYDEDALHGHMEDMAWVEAHASRHEEVLVQSMEFGALVPMSFCTIFTTEDNIKTQLRDNQESLIQELTKLGNCREMHLRLYVNPKRLQAKLQEEKPFNEGTRGGNYFLKRQWEKSMEKEMEQRMDDYGEGLYQEMKEFAQDDHLQDRAEVQPPQELMVVFAAQFLIRKDQQDEWERKILDFDQVVDPWGFVLDVSGPWPPYHFVRGDGEE